MPRTFIQTFFSDSEDESEALGKGARGARGAGGARSRSRSIPPIPVDLVSRFDVEAHNFLFRLKHHYHVPPIYLEEPFLANIWHVLMGDPSMHLQLPKDGANMISGLVLRHGMRVCTAIITAPGHRNCIWKIGITRLPVDRWQAVYARETDFRGNPVYSDITFIYLSHTWQFPAFLEAALIQILTLQYTGGQNSRPGGEGASHDSPPFFTYIVHRYDV